MSLLRFLGIGADERSTRGDTDTVRRISARLEALAPDRARYVAAFAYVLARVAAADLKVSEEETSRMQEVVERVGHLPTELAALVVEIAKSQARLLGGTENYVVTREFAKISTREQRAELLLCLFAVAAADARISSTESGEIAAIADELGFTRAETNGLRARFRETQGT
jgi:uncharacterized tellurite resistance protein B-like protein